MRRIILILGAAGTGKSTLARKLSVKLGIPWISTDRLHATVHAIASPDKFPAICAYDGVSPKEYYERFSPSEAFDNEIAWTKELWPAVKSFILYEHSSWVGDWDSFILEGVNMLPEDVASLLEGSSHIVPLVIVDASETHIREIVYSRGLWAEADSYPDEIKPLEVQQLVVANSYFEREASMHSLPVFKAGTDILSEVIDYLD